MPPAIPSPADNTASLGKVLFSMASLLGSFALLMGGTGLFNTFIGLRANAEGFTEDTIGYLIAGYFVGLVVGSVRCGLLINRIGHIRAFAAFSSVIATVVLMFPFLPNIWAWTLLRAVIGFNVAGVFMVAESWLNHKATPATRGAMLSAYMMTSYLAMGGGQYLINLGNLDGLELFMIASMLFGLAVVPVAITRATHPPPVESTQFDLVKLYRVSPVALVACFASGLEVSALWGMGPIFGAKLGMDAGDVAQFMGIMVLSAMLLQFPLGRLSDRFDRRRVILGVALIATAVSMAMVYLLFRFQSAMPWPLGASLTWIYHREPLVAVAALFGGVIATLYPLSVAYANDYVEAKDLVPASAGLVLTFGIGAAIGPIPAGWLMYGFGASGLFVHTAFVTLALSVFVLYRMRRRAWAPVEEKESFVALPDATTTPSPLEADPRGE